MTKYRQLAEDFSRNLPSTPTVEDQLIAALYRSSLNQTLRYFAHLSKANPDEGIRREAEREVLGLERTLNKLKLVTNPMRNDVLEKIARPIIESNLSTINDRQVLLLEAVIEYNSPLFAYLTSLKKRTNCRTLGRTSTKGIPHKALYTELLSSCLGMETAFCDIIEYRTCQSEKDEVVDQRAIENYRSKALTLIERQGKANSMVNKQVASDWAARSISLR